MDIQLGNRTITDGVPIDNTLISMLLWGMAGCGKTTLAATAPGNKLWLLFDREGASSLAGRSDIRLLDLSQETRTIIPQLKTDDPLGLSRVLSTQEISTVVFDSATAFTLLAVDDAVANVNSATHENPGLKGYGHRNAVVLRCLVALMRLCKKHNKHLIIITHEDTPEKNTDGSIVSITMMLGGKMANSLGLQLSEIWWMSQTDKGERRIAVRPLRMRQPMKTRMFSSSGNTGEFTWKYDPDTYTGEGIEAWFKKWKETGGRKIPLPK